MTCESFNNIVHELSTGRSLDGRTERDARSHSSECDKCAAVLAEQRRLTALLGHVAAADVDLEAPERIEATVLGAFRLAHGTANVVPLHPVAEASVVARRRVSSRWLAAAAAIVIGVAGTLFTWQALQGGPIAVPTPGGESTAVRPSGEVAPPLRPVPPPRDRSDDDDSYGGSVPGRGIPEGPAIPVASNAGGRRTSRPPRSLPTTEPTELVTDFYSLVPASGFAPTEGGQLVRLQVPRASLASLGVPLPYGNPDGSVTADLVMGYDGVAHAIRFVQPNMTDERRIR